MIENLMMIAEALVVMSLRRNQEMIEKALSTRIESPEIPTAPKSLGSLRGSQKESEVMVTMIVKCPPMIVKVESVMSEKGQRGLVRNVVSKGVMVVMGVVILLSSSLARGRVLLGH
jgi:hypothetical protein